MSKSPASLETVVEIVRKHVAKTKRNVVLDADTLLFQQGLIDSYGMVDVIAALENAAGASFPEGAFLPDDFESARTLHARLLDLA